MIQTTLPRIFPPRLIKDEAVENLVEMVCLVDGGTMSLRATMRSYIVSSVRESDSTDDRETEEEEREDIGEP